MIAVLCCLACAATWAVASVLFTRVMRAHPSIDPQALNLTKSAIALPCLLAIGVVTGAGLPTVDGTIGWLALSAILGLLVADTGYFFALKKLGAARGVLFIPLVPVVTAVMAAVFLDEPLGLAGLIGMGLTLTGVAIVLVQPDASSSMSLVGVAGGVIYALSQAGANVVVKHVVSDAVAVHTAALRVGVGVFALLGVSLATNALPGLRPLKDKRVVVVIVCATLIGTVLGLWLGTVGVKGLPVGVATTLCATTPLFALGVARFFGETIPVRAVVGAVVAVAGVVVLASSSLE